MVVLPCHDEPDAKSVLQSLAGCDQADCLVEVIVVVNEPLNADEGLKARNQNSLQSVLDFKKNEFPFFGLETLYVRLPEKHAGVGLARKIGMDEAAFRLYQAGNFSAPIVCLDMDCRVSRNYLTEIHRHFFNNPESPACSIRFEHPVSGELPSENYDGIIRYELYLRYYVNALRWAGYPFAFQTIGSSMACRADSYCRMGGMNRRKAGEDFYFLHKIIPLGHFSEINSACVYPSPRSSRRVPFGTGKAVQAWLDKPDFAFPVYNFRIFRDFRALIHWVREDLSFDDVNSVELPQEFSECLREWCRAEKFIAEIIKARANSNRRETFVKRLFNWLDGFRTLKFVHFARDHYYPNQPILECCDELNFEMGIKNSRTEAMEFLLQFRDHDANGEGIR